MFDSLFSLVALAAMGLACYAVGRPVVRALGVEAGDRLLAVVWSVAVGLIVAGTALAGLGLAGMLYPPLIGVLSLAACFWGLGQIVSHRIANQRGTRTDNWRESAVPREVQQSAWPSPPEWMTWGALGLAALACSGSLVSALAPPTAGDALCYHLELPKAFLADHAISHMPYSENSTYPLLVEMWYLWGLALDGGVAAQLVHWGAGVLLGLATLVLAAPIVGRRWAWIAGCLVVLVPGVNNQMTAPLNDAALALLTTLALAAWWRAVVAGEGRRWFVLAGLAAGGAIGTKYIAVLFAAAVGITAVWAFFRYASRRRLVAEGAAIVAVVAISVGGLWYVRAAWHRGNPVYPFLVEVFGSSDPSAAGEQQTLPASKSPLGRSLAGLLCAPWQVTMHPERFGGRGHQLGMVFLAAVPGVLVARRLHGLGTLLAAGLGYFFLWYLLRQNVRFLLPAVPLWSVGVVWVWAEMSRFPSLPRRIAGLAFAAVLAASALIPLARSRQQVPVALGLESRDAYLARREPTWPAACVSNQWFGPDAHLLSQDYRAFYFQCRVTRESVYRRWTHYDEAIADPADLGRTLRQAGFTHLLLAENVRDRGIQYDPTLSRLVEAAKARPGGSLVELADYLAGDADGGLRRYRLIMLR